MTIIELLDGMERRAERQDRPSRGPSDCGQGNWQIVQEDIQVTTTKQLHIQAIEYLRMARQSMKKLAGCTPDWSAGVQVECEFDALEQTCNDFARSHFGIKLPHKRITQ
ncbi:MAG: hypothetical protein ACODAD_16060 [Planctomycetota bacterium]